ncbi:MAG TPA: S9 family peptidase [Flavipsychrobacter sp.]|nr:S9 family peptidase [Flavipsychrobacter sp.]
MRKLFLLAFLTVSHLCYAQKKSIMLEDIWLKSTFASKSVPGFNALKNGMQYTKQEKTEMGATQINVYNLASGEKQKTIFDNSQQQYNGRSIVLHSYSFNEAETQMLLFEEPEYIYRRSAVYHVYVYDIATKTVKLLQDKKVLHAQFSPDGSKVAFVRENNLYYQDLNSSRTTQITKDGRWNEIINGNCDWVYEEEFGFTQAYQWSPDGKTIAFYRFDERKVPEYTMTRYDALYPTPYKYKYPVAGEANSVIQIKLYHLSNGKTVNADLGKEADQYIPRIKWTNRVNELCIYRMNRHQNKLELLLTNAASGQSKIIYEENNKYYIDIDDNLQFLPDGQSFIFSSERSGYCHFYKWNFITQQLTSLTSGNYDIEKLIGIDESSQLLYYTSAEQSSLQRKLYCVDWNGGGKRTLTPENGTHDITTITGYRFFLDKHSSLNKPPVYYLRDKNGAIVRILEDNAKLADKMNEYALGKLKFFEVEGAQEGILLNGWMITPPDFDKTKKHPVLMFQYSGPGSQQVLDAFPAKDLWWHQMLAQKGYIIVCVDGTGTGFRGEEFKKKTYLQLGKLESDDQIAVARNLSELPYVDKDRIGIWGWSFGGFMSSNCILKGEDVFKAAIAVAPVTNWRYYDNIYTERYMRTPAENAQGYDNNAPEKLAANLKGKFLLVHGTGDDNVHFQNAVSLVNELIKNNKDFDSEFYPDRAHGISGGNTRYHLYKRMTDFILNNL